MAFETEYLAGGLEAYMDDGTLNYRRLLAIRVSLLATTDAPTLATFDSDFADKWGFDELLGMKQLPAAMQERVVLWARLKMLELRAVFNVVALPAYADSPYFFTYYADDQFGPWMHLDDRTLWTVVLATEYWYAINVRGVVGPHLVSFLTPLLPEIDGGDESSFGLSLNYATEQLRAAVSLVRIKTTGYETVVDLDDSIMEPSAADVAIRYRDRNYQTYLEIMGWLAEGLTTITLAEQRQAFNAISQTDWGTDAVAPLVAEMVELFRKLAALGAAGSIIDHKMIRAHAEMVGHGYVPEVRFQLVSYLPGEAGIDVPGAIWIEFPAQIANEKTLSCTLKVFVPEGTNIDFLRAHLQHVDGNGLFTRYANADNAVAVDADRFIVTNLDDGGVGQTRFEMDVAAGFLGGAGGTVFDIGTFDLHYLTIGAQDVDLPPRPYQMQPVIDSAEDGHTPFVASEATITFGGFTTSAGDKIVVPNITGGADHVLEADVDFDDGATAGSANALAASAAAAIGALPGYDAVAALNVVTVTVTDPDTLDAGTDPADIVFLGADINADVGGTDATPSQATLTLGGFTTAVGNTITLPNLSGGVAHVLVAGTDFDDGATAGSANALATSIAAAIDALPGYAAGAALNVVTVDVEDDLTIAAGADPADITFTGAEIIADMGGAAESFAGAVAPVGEAFAGAVAAVAGVVRSGAFFMKGVRMLAGFINDGSKNYAFDEMEEGLTS